MSFILSRTKGHQKGGTGGCPLFCENSGNSKRREQICWCSWKGKKWREMRFCILKVTSQRQRDTECPSPPLTPSQKHFLWFAVIIFIQSHHYIKCFKARVKSFFSFCNPIFMEMVDPFFDIWIPVANPNVEILESFVGGSAASPAASFSVLWRGLDPLLVQQLHSLRLFRFLFSHLPLSQVQLLVSDHLDRHPTLPNLASFLALLSCLWFLREHKSLWHHHFH